MTFTMWVTAMALTGAIQTGAMQTAAAAPQRFDYLVRADFFAGAAGDEARLAHVLDVCEQALEKNPNHAEARVWHGAVEAIAPATGAQFSVLPSENSSGSRQATSPSPRKNTLFERG